jgi:hypothetical protein
MPTIKVLPISSCNQCYYLLYSRLGNHCCSLANNKDIINLSEIPNWCKLATTTVKIKHGNKK